MGDEYRTEFWETVQMVISRNSRLRVSTAMPRDPAHRAINNICNLVVSSGLGAGHGDTQPIEKAWQSSSPHAGETTVKSVKFMKP